MKKWMIFGGGAITGIVLTILFLFIIGGRSSEQIEKESERTNKVEEKSKEKSDDGITLFDEPGDIIKVKSFKVIQVIAKDAALVMEEGYNMTVYLLTNSDDKFYYDDEIVKVPKGKVVKQIGIYRYPAKNDIIKTVPIVMITDE